VKKSIGTNEGGTLKRILQKVDTGSFKSRCKEYGRRRDGAPHYLFSG